MSNSQIVLIGGSPKKPFSGPREEGSLGVGLIRLNFRVSCRSRVTSLGLGLGFDSP